MNKLKEIRNRKGYTQFELAKEINVHPNVISEVERGRRDLRFQAAVKAAEFLGVSLDELAGRDSLYVTNPNGNIELVDDIGEIK